MALSQKDRARVWRAIMRHWSRRGTPAVSLVKHELFNQNLNTGMIALLDHWLDTHLPPEGNATGLAGAFPPAQIAALGGEQSLLDLLLAVVAMRMDASGERLYTALGERG